MSIVKELDILTKITFNGSYNEIILKLHFFTSDKVLFCQILIAVQNNLKIGYR